VQTAREVGQRSSSVGRGRTRSYRRRSSWGGRSERLHPATADHRTAEHRDVCNHELSALLRPSELRLRLPLLHLSQPPTDLRFHRPRSPWLMLAMRRIEARAQLTADASSGEPAVVRGRPDAGKRFAPDV
jgi:hypothetical protein